MTRLLLAWLAGALAVLLPGAPAAAHDSTTTAHAQVRDAGDGVDVAVVLELEYDLLLKSAWLYADAYEATDRDEQLGHLTRHAVQVTDYAVERFQVAYAGARCVAAQETAPGVTDREGRAFAVLTLRYDCRGGAGGTHTVFSALFPDSESFVHSTRTMVTYDLDGAAGTTLLAADHPQSDLNPPDLTQAGLTPATESRLAGLGGFLLLGAEHLVLGADHVLFLLALLVASRTVRDVLVAATAFTAAHSVTFLLAATGVVAVPAAVVEPVIALSIAVVAVLHLVAWGRGRGPTRMRVAVVLGFGLLHGLGFAGALGIDEPWSWDLLWSLLAFNVGIEVAQLALVLLVFPLLVVLRRVPRGDQVLAGVAVAITLVATLWCVERVAGAGDAPAARAAAVADHRAPGSLSPGP